MFNENPSKRTNYEITACVQKEKESPVIIWFVVLCKVILVGEESAWRAAVHRRRLIYSAHLPSSSSKTQSSEQADDEQWAFLRNTLGTYSKVAVICPF